MYKVFVTQSFEKSCAKRLSLEELHKLKRLQQTYLPVNPYIGDPLGFTFFREKRLGGKRVYYLIYEDLSAVYLVDISDKKDQQETINRIKNALPDLYIEIHNAFTQHDERDRT